MYRYLNITIIIFTQSCKKFIYELQLNSRDTILFPRILYYHLIKCVLFYVGTNIDKIF